MNLTEIVGYAYEGYVICIGCDEDCDGHPIFEGDYEEDWDPVCDICLEPLWEPYESEASFYCEKSSGPP